MRSWQHAALFIGLFGLSFLVGYLYSMHSDRQTQIEHSANSQGWSLYASGEYQRAADEFRSYLQTDQNNIPAQLGLGASLIRLHDYEDAIAPLEKFIALYPRAKTNTPRVYNLLGTAYARTGDLERAQSTFMILSDADPLSRAQAHIGLTILSLAEGDHQEAWRHTIEAQTALTELGEGANRSIALKEFNMCMSGLAFEPIALQKCADRIG